MVAGDAIARRLKRASDYNLTRVGIRDRDFKRRLYRSMRRCAVGCNPKSSDGELFIDRRLLVPVDWAVETPRSDVMEGTPPFQSPLNPPRKR